MRTTQGTSKNRRYRYRYLDVEIPGDIYTDAGYSASEEMEALGQHAIAAAEDRITTFVLPASWSARLIGGEPGDFSMTFRVCRKSRKV